MNWELLKQWKDTSVKPPGFSFIGPTYLTSQEDENIFMD